MKFEQRPVWQLARRVWIQVEEGSPQQRALADCRALDAYVLLGDPGAGKSWAMEVECAATPGARWIDIRALLAGIEEPALPNDTVFIDRLDELRIGSAMADTAFNTLALWLKRSGGPRLRLACREADWLGEADRSLIQRALGGRTIDVLHLQPFDAQDIRRVLSDRRDELGEPDAFWAQAEQKGLVELLANPLMLDLLVSAVSRAGGNWPGSTRTAVFEFACRELVQEHSRPHRRALAAEPGLLDQLLDTAGDFCALQLLSGRAGWQLDAGPATAEFLNLNGVPGDMNLPLADAVLRSKLFTVRDGLAEPRHRRIAEFLAGRRLAARIQTGLPLGRLHALVLGFDGRPVEALRGLLAWLAVHLQGADRLACLRLDPLGFVLNGDAATLTPGERVQLLEALAQRAEENPWFRESQWVSHPFGALASADMEPEFRRLLRESSRSTERLAFMSCVFDALQHGAAMPGIAPDLLPWVEEETRLRWRAFEAWERQVPPNARVPQLLSWWQALNAGELSDSDDELRALLLRRLYPAQLSTHDLLVGLAPRKPRSHIGGLYHRLWDHELVALTPPSRLASLADAWVARHPHGLPRDQQQDAADLIEGLLPRLLAEAGDQASDEALFDWLGMGLDQFGSLRLDQGAKTAVCAWLADRPARRAALLELGYSQLHPDSTGNRNLWQVEERFCRAPLPPSWPTELMRIALHSNNPRLVEHLVCSIAIWRIDPPASLQMPDIEVIQDWVAELTPRFPQAGDWLQRCWTCSLEDDWRAERAQHERQERAERESKRLDRRRQFESNLQELLRGKLQPGLLGQLALAHERRYMDIEGETPAQRVADFLGVSEPQAEQAIDQLMRVNERDDLPSADEVLDLDRSRKFHWIRPAALLAARLHDAQSPTHWQTWSGEQAQRMAAFWLTEGSGETPAWFKALVQARPEQLAPVFTRYAVARLRKGAKTLITNLSSLWRDEGFAGLVPMVLPSLLQAIPPRASEPQRRVLNHDLLPALHLLPRETAAALVRAGLERPGLDPVQRLGWLVAKLPFDVQAVVELERALRGNERRLVLVGEALREQAVLSRVGEGLPVPTLRRLIELLAPITRPNPEGPGGWVSAAWEREDSVRAMIRLMAATPTEEARTALAALAELPALRHWQTELSYQRQAQSAALREANFQLPSPQAVAMALLNRRPAHPADLQALLVDHLRDLAKRVRDTASYQLPQFWRDDRRTPKVEEACRDVLLAQLQPRLEPLQVTLDPEHRHADAKRVDLSASAWGEAGQLWTLPIEIKQDRHREVLSAWRHQLKRLYASDMQAQGYGIYLVLWFGTEGKRFNDPQSFEQALRERMNEEERQRLAVVVLDLSWPEPT